MLIGWWHERRQGMAEVLDWVLEGWLGVESFRCTVGDE
jgi:hypothetical protein